MKVGLSVVFYILYVSGHHCHLQGIFHQLLHNDKLAIIGYDSCDIKMTD